METRLLSGANLSFDSSVEGDAERFRQVFLATWELMPAGIRRVLTSHWNERTTGSLIEFFPFEWNSRKGNIGGQTLESGYRLQFNRDVFVLCDKILFRVVIAHELAHAFFIASSQPQHVVMATHVDKITTELLAFELTRRMGFPQDRLFEWINCSMSEQGPYLRAECGEAEWPGDELWARWRELELSWQMAYRPSATLDQAKADLYSEHAGYFNIALGD